MQSKEFRKPTQDEVEGLIRYYVAEEDKIIKNCKRGAFVTGLLILLMTISAIVSIVRFVITEEWVNFEYSFILADLVFLVFFIYFCYCLVKHTKYVKECGNLNIQVLDCKVTKIETCYDLPGVMLVNLDAISGLYKAREEELKVGNRYRVFYINNYYPNTVQMLGFTDYMLSDEGLKKRDW